jgi:hypothetical protein
MMRVRYEPFHGIEAYPTDDITPGRYHVARVSHGIFDLPEYV